MVIITLPSGYDVASHTYVERINFKHEWQDLLFFVFRVVGDAWPTVGKSNKPT